MQHPVVLDEATAARLGYGSTCILSPARAAATGVNSGGEGDGAIGGGGGPAKGGAVSDDIPELGGTFRMWSDYRMSLEGSASNVQAGTLLPPVLEVARTVADSFRRCWAAGGQYPERKLARVWLTERRREGDDHAGHGIADAEGGNGETPAVATVAPTERPAAAKQRWRKIAGVVSRAGQAVAFRSGRAPGAGARLREEGEGSQSALGTEREEDGSSTPPQDRRLSGSRRSTNSSFRQALSRLDTLDTGTLVEEALEDLHDEEGILSLSSAASGEGGVTRRGRQSRGGSFHSDLQRGPEETLATREGVALVGTAPSGAGEDAIVAPDNMNDDPADAVVEVAEAEASEAGTQRPIAEKFMLPGWHYLYLSGRSMSMDIRWTNLDLLLMQDPTVPSARDSGKNVLALRSSGTLTMRSSGPGESVDVQLERASLLPCFYSDEEGEGGTVGPQPDSDPLWNDSRRDEVENVLGSPEGVSVAAQGWHGGERGLEELVNRVGGVSRSARCLAELLGGGDRVLAAVRRTWLGQGLVTADSRPLLKPFSIQSGYGTVVAQSSREGHGTGVAAGGHVIRGDENGQVAQDSACGAGVHALASDVDRGVDDEEEHGVQGGRVGDIGDGEVAAGVFRVAVSELQLLAGHATLKGPAIIEVEVSVVSRMFFLRLVAAGFRSYAVLSASRRCG